MRRFIITLYIFLIVIAISFMPTLLLSQLYLKDEAGSISGKITSNKDSQPIKNILVEAISSNNIVFSATSDDKGNYKILFVPSGEYIVHVLTENTNFIEEYWNDKKSKENADKVIVKEGEDTGNINFGLDEFGSVSGNITSSKNGNPVKDIVVEVLTLEGKTLISSSSPSDILGNYKAIRIPQGSYIARTKATATFPQKYYKDSNYISGATSFNVINGQVTTNINFTLDPTSEGPFIESVTPQEGKNDEDTIIVITGKNFIGSTVVEPIVALYNGTNTYIMKDVTYIDRNILNSIIQAGLKGGLYDLIVSNPDGQTDILEEAFLVISVIDSSEESGELTQETEKSEESLELSEESYKETGEESEISGGEIEETESSSGRGQNSGGTYLKEDEGCGCNLSEKKENFKLNILILISLNIFSIIYLSLKNKKI